MKRTFPTIYLLWLATSPSQVATQEVCTPCSDGLDPFLVSKLCESGVELAATLTSDTEECDVLQLTLYQGDCCDTPPEGYCTLCENGSQDYNLNKVVPPGAGDPPIEATCEDYATRAQYVREGATGICADTERARARAWCECDGMQPACTLTCDDGNPPPDMSKADPIFLETCERFAYEYTTLSTEECADPAVSLNFDAKAFCCGESPSNECSVCPEGMKLGDTTMIVQTEFFGSVTCGEIATYASYMPAGVCSVFVSELLDDPLGTENQCCVPNQSSGGINRDRRVASVSLFVLMLFSLVTL